MVSGFTVAFNITCYITDGHRFSFVAALPKPFNKFSLNNSIIPLAFMITYLYQLISNIPVKNPARSMASSGPVVYSLLIWKLMS